MTEKLSSENCISKIIENAEDDRDLALACLKDLLTEIEEAKKDADKNERAGKTAQKYIDSMQKANEQLIKVARILKDKEQEEDQSYTSAELFDEIQDEEVVLPEESEVNNG